MAALIPLSVRVPSQPGQKRLLSEYYIVNYIFVRIRSECNAWEEGGARFSDFVLMGTRSPGAPSDL